MKTLLRRHQMESFLPYNFSHRCEKDRLHDPDGEENGLFAATKRIASGCARNAPFLLLNS
jgi:hypothetical protein